MNTSRPFRITLLALLCAALGPAGAADEASPAVSNEVFELARPASTIRLGFGRLNGDPARHGEFTGADEAGWLPALNLDLVRRDDENGTWIRFYTANLEQDNRRLRFEHEQQGHWRYYLDYSRLPHHSPLRFVTGLVGIGTEQQQVAGMPQRALTLDNTRDVLGIGLKKTLGDAFETHLRARRETHHGNRPLGKDGRDFITEPIHSVAEEIEATFAYHDKQLQLQGGYLGAWYRNRLRSFTVRGNEMDSFTSGADPDQISLPFDNQSHQLFFSGGYSLSPATRASFKLSREKATQNESFFPLAVGTAFSATPSLDGRVDTTLAFAGISSQPLKELSLLANFRYEDRDDRTPIRQYITAASNFPHGLNSRFPRTTTTGRAEATWHLTREDSLAFGLDHDRRRREVPHTIPYTAPDEPAQTRQASLRSETEEAGYRLEYRRSLNADINGSLAHITSRRTGSTLLPADDNPAPDLVAPIHWADRERSKWRLVLDWVPIEPLSLQFVAENANDRYSGRDLGFKQGKQRLLSLDVSYVLSNDWQLTGWLSENTIDSRQASCGGITPNPVSGERMCLLSPTWIQWQTRLADQSNGGGLGLRGSPTRKMKLGADFVYARERNGFAFDVLSASATTAMPGGLPPAIHYRTRQLSAFIDYTLSSNEGWRIDLVDQRVRTDDWSWDLFGTTVYRDGSKVLLDKDTAVYFIGMSYYHRWR